MYSYPYPNNYCSGMLFQRTNKRKFNIKQDKLPASSFTTQKKILAVTEQFAENQTTNNTTDCPGLIPAITNSGGPGNKISHNGLDKKHNHYGRYLARKKGWIMRNQHCNVHNNVIFSIPPIAPSIINNNGGNNDNNNGGNNGNDDGGDNNGGDNNGGDNNGGDNNGNDYYDYYGDDNYDDYY